MIQRSFIGLIFCFVILFESGCVARPHRADARVTELESAAARRVEVALDKPISVAFDHTPASEAFAKIAELAGVQTDVRWLKLQEVGVEESAPVTMKYEHLSARTVLGLVFAQVSGDESNPLDARTREGLVRISTRRDLDRFTVLRVYNVQDLMLAWSFGVVKPQSFDLSTALSSTNSGGGNQPVARDVSEPKFMEDSRPTPEMLAAQGDAIADLLQSNVGEPEGWATAGGTVSSVRLFDGKLVVRTTPENHREIAKLLEQLRHPLK